MSKEGSAKMNVSSVMNTYNLTSLLDSPNSMGVPLVTNVNTAVNENYELMNFSGQNTNSELQDIFQQVDPTLNLPVTYDQNGNINFQNNLTLPSSVSSFDESNMSTLLQDSNLIGDSIYSNVLPLYDAIKNGAYQMGLAGVLSSYPTNNQSSSSLINELTGTNWDISV